MPSLFDPMTINGMELPNRLFRSATVENLGDQGMVTDALLSVYRELARGEPGLIFTGGLFPKKAGQIVPGQLGAHAEETIPGLKRLVKIVHENGAKLAAQLLHSGWLCSSAVTGCEAEAPSATVHPFLGVPVRELSGEEIWELVDLFVEAGRRALEAGFDAIQLHGAHSHLISMFLSPVANKRDDEWGGSAEKRSAFVRRICNGIKELAGQNYPVFVKLGLCDYHPEGKTLSEGLETARSMEAVGVGAIEVSEGFEEVMAHHIRADASSPYYLHECRNARKALSLPLILVGGMRKVKDMQAVLDEGIADAVSMSRPFINDPHIVRKFREGVTVESECTSCNGCLEQMGKGDFRCILQDTRS